MKRYEALAPLSREHHATLILAQLLRKNAPAYKGLPSGLKEKGDYAKQQFEGVIKKHFQVEETMLEKVKDCHNDIKKLAGEIKDEHQQLAELFLSPDSIGDEGNNLDILGKALESHIRKEERILFPLIQKYCPREILKEIWSLLH
jgi:iron-sulfur cluster repair protein YtfE (RIC family)